MTNSRLSGWIGSPSFVSKLSTSAVSACTIGSKSIRAGKRRDVVFDSDIRFLPQHYTIVARFCAVQDAREPERDNAVRMKELSVSGSLK